MKSVTITGQRLPGINSGDVGFNSLHLTWDARADTVRYTTPEGTAVWQFVKNGPEALQAYAMLKRTSFQLMGLL